MDKMDYPRGLVRYTTEHAVHSQTTHVLRPRMFVYATLLLLLIAGLVTSMAMRTPIILDVIRDRNSLYRELPGDMVENIYTIKVINQSDNARSFVVGVSGFEGISLDGVGDGDIVHVDGGVVLSLPVRVRAHRDNVYGIMTIQFSVTATDDESVSIQEDSRFLGPTP